MLKMEYFDIEKIEKPQVPSYGKLITHPVSVYFQCFTECCKLVFYIQ